MNRSLFENIVELDPYLESFVTESDVQTEEGFVALIKPETEAQVGLHVADPQFGPPVKYLAGIAVQRHIQAAEYLPPVLGAGHEEVVAAEAVWPVSSQVFGAA